jgi:hypothetical protein
MITYILKIVLYTLIISSIFYGCEKESETLVVNDNLIYFDSRVTFSDHYYTDNNDGTAILETTVAVPSDINILGYGHCWIDYNGIPTIDDSKTLFDQINSTNFTIRSTISNYNSWTRYYDRAYIITVVGIIYDETYYFP